MPFYCRSLVCLALCLTARPGLAVAQSYEKLHDFSCQTTGCAPNTTLVAARDGAFYGITSEGGPSDDGVAFRLESDGTITSLGHAPGAFFEGSDGSFYGVVYDPPVDTPYGAVFKMDRGGAWTVLHSFDETTGSPAGLLQGSDGLLYGMTAGGTAFEDGTVFRMDLSGDVSMLRGFKRPTGIYLRALLLAGTDSSTARRIRAVPEGPDSSSGSAAVGPCTCSCPSRPHRVVAPAANTAI